MSPLEKLEKNLSQDPVERNNQKHFIRLVRAFREDLAEAAEKYGIDSERYKSILANAHQMMDCRLPHFLDFIVLGHASTLSPW